MTRVLAAELDVAAGRELERIAELLKVGRRSKRDSIAEPRVDVESDDQLRERCRARL